MTVNRFFLSGSERILHNPDVLVLLQDLETLGCCFYGILGTRGAANAQAHNKKNLHLQDLRLR